MLPMNKIEASEFLGVGVRSLERYTTKNRIAARYEKGKTGKTLVYDRDELERFKAELESATHLPTVEAAGAPTNRMETPISPSSATPANGLARVGAGNDIGLAILQALSQLQPAAPALAAPAEPHGVPSLPVSQKLMLTLDEAQVYSGLSRANLMDAIHAETLRAQKIGRGWKIKRRDLESYVKEL